MGDEVRLIVAVGFGQMDLVANPVGLALGVQRRDKLEPGDN
jgi:hypothetical protein